MAEINAGPSPSGFAPPGARVSRDADGCLVLRHAIELAPYDRQVGDWVRRWAAAAPERLALGDWDEQGQPRGITYAELRRHCDALSQALLDRGLGADRPVALLSEKSLPHALLTLAALQVGIPVAPISPAYSLRPEARGRLLSCLRAAAPALVLVDDGEAFAEAVAALPEDVPVVFETRPPPGRRQALPFAALLDTVPGPAVEAAFAAVDPDAPAKILFTSGSTGEPKPVINTHRMMCSNAQAQRQLFPFLGERPPVVMDWQPWHHCGGSSHNFHAALSNGGTYHIDRGKPTTDAAFAPTLHALRQVSPTLHFNVPQGYDRLAFHLARDAVLARRFFAELDCIVYSAASMPPPLWEALERLSVAARGARVPMVSSYGMTEMAPLHTSLHWHEGRPGMIGLPIPGSAVKLVPVADKLELRARGPNLTPGYHREPALTAAAFDAEGWYRSGDAVRFVDPDDPSRGLLFEGRLTDQFKLQSGTWVQVGNLRTAVVAAASPLLEDVLVVGENRTELGVLAIPNLSAGREIFGRPEMTLPELAALPALRERLRDAIAAFNRDNSASSRRIARVLPIHDVPSLAAGETTDKGHINQKLAVARRPALVATLFDDADPAVLRP
ncbi:feruloyl-CoA synthase [Roseomonas sp. BN140053]|uniref:feruloyl-CoA synthase n=1 Tax=Roseomonas sp. BN140053 TaxID=3391898 RepID=UPI0039E944F2